ncbi:MAG: hypothetical protein DMF89_17340 [Acidobacteria bacterium]|nr:MAG: hypothetical protein DMF89_17340 [Acidobacteriota bacterium]
MKRQAHDRLLTGEREPVDPFGPNPREHLFGPPLFRRPPFVRYAANRDLGIRGGELEEDRFGFPVVETRNRRNPGLPHGGAVLRRGLRIADDVQREDFHQRGSVAIRW